MRCTATWLAEHLPRGATIALSCALPGRPQRRHQVPVDDRRRTPNRSVFDEVTVVNTEGVSVRRVRGADKNGELSLTRGQPLGPIGEQGARRAHPQVARPFRWGERSAQTWRASPTETARGLARPVLRRLGSDLSRPRPKWLTPASLNSDQLETSPPLLDRHANASRSGRADTSTSDWPGVGGGWANAQELPPSRHRVSTATC